MVGERSRPVDITYMEILLEKGSGIREGRVDRVKRQRQRKTKRDRKKLPQGNGRNIYREKLSRVCLLK